MQFTMKDDCPYAILTESMIRERARSYEKLKNALVDYSYEPNGAVSKQMIQRLYLRCERELREYYNGKGRLHHDAARHSLSFEIPLAYALELKEPEDRHLFTEIIKQTDATLPIYNEQFIIPMHLLTHDEHKKLTEMAYICQTHYGCTLCEMIQNPISGFVCNYLQPFIQSVKRNIHHAIEIQTDVVYEQLLLTIPITALMDDVYHVVRIRTNH